jgi:hypothetical protein
MASSSSSSITRFLEEVTPGTIEAGGPQIWRVLDGALVQGTTSTEDKEIRNDRGKGDSTLVSGTVGGSYNVNISHTTHDDFLEALLAGTFTTVGTNGVATVADMTFNSSTNTIGGATTLPLLEKGQWFKISGADDPLNDGVYKASSSVAPTTSAIVVDTAVKTVAATDTAASTSLSAGRLKQGYADPRSFTLERELSDDSRFFTWKGAYVSSANIAFALDKEVTASLSFMGSETEVFGTTTQFSGISSEVAATTTKYFSSVTNTHILMDGVAMGDSCVENLSIEISGNLRERRCIGAGLAASSIGFDPFTVKCTASMFFGSSGSASLYGKKLTDVALTFAVCVTDSDGNSFAITIPRAKITQGDVPGGSLGSDVMLTLAFEASTDTTLNTLIAIDRMGSTA